MSVLQQKAFPVVLKWLRKHPPVRWSEWLAVQALHHFTLSRLKADASLTKLLARAAPRRVIATACCYFPIYSQTFVHQELTQFIKRGFALRFIYSKLEPRDYLPGQFAPLWRAKRKLLLHRGIYENDFAYYQKRAPDKVEALFAMLCNASELSREQLSNHVHFMQGFSFARVVQAYNPGYLHSYFFYERTLFTLIASFLLNIPRGITCYADHLLRDYELKVVPLHLEHCDLIVATSKRIKSELLQIAPNTDPDRILVKPNAINAAYFPSTSRQAPAQGRALRLVCVSRIEPKKGLVYLIEALGVLRDRAFEVECHLLGAPDYNQKSSTDYWHDLQSRITSLGLDECVHLQGRRPESEVRRFLQSSHIFVAPFVETTYGDKDGIPTSLLEAMATGLPVVATDAGSILEVIDNGYDGLIVPQHDAKALAAAIADLIRDPALRSQLGERAAQKIRLKFDVAGSEAPFHDRVSKLLQAERRATTN